MRVRLRPRLHHQPRAVQDRFVEKGERGGRPRPQGTRQPLFHPHQRPSLPPSVGPGASSASRPRALLDIYMCTITLKPMFRTQDPSRCLMREHFSPLNDLTGACVSLYVSSLTYMQLLVSSTCTVHTSLASHVLFYLPRNAHQLPNLSRRTYCPLSPLVQKTGWYRRCAKYPAWIDMVTTEEKWEGIWKESEERGEIG